MKLNDLSSPKGAKKKERRVGRGPGSGHGKTSGKGHKGQKARAGRDAHPGFEGGQMPIIRRLPKRGFTHINRNRKEIVNIGKLSMFNEDTVVGPDELKKAGLAEGKHPLKILGKGKLPHKLTVRAHSFSKKALSVIESSGGKVEVIT